MNLLCFGATLGGIMLTFTNPRTVAPGIALLIVSLGAFAQIPTSPQTSSPQNPTSQPFNLQALLDAQRAVQEKNAMCESFALLGINEKLCKSTSGAVAFEGGRLIWKQNGTIILGRAKDPALQKQALDLQRKYKANLMMMLGTQEERAAIMAGDFAHFIGSPIARRLGLGLMSAGAAYEFWLLNHPTPPALATEPPKK